MSSLLPHPPYAEDQPLAHTILTTHVLLRGFQTGAIIGPLVGSTRYILLQRLQRSTLSPPTPPPQAKFLPAIVRTTGSSSLVFTGILVLALVGRMQGREEIEWKDRSWRLLENRGQLEVDGFAGVGMGVGGVVGALGRGGGLRWGLGGWWDVWDWVGRWGLWGIWGGGMGSRGGDGRMRGLRGKVYVLLGCGWVHLSKALTVDWHLNMENKRFLQWFKLRGSKGLKLSVFLIAQPIWRRMPPL